MKAFLGMMTAIVIVGVINNRVEEKLSIKPTKSKTEIKLDVMNSQADLIIERYAIK